MLDLERRVVDPVPARRASRSSSRRIRWQSSPRSTSTWAESAGKPELISQTCRSWTSVTPRVRPQQRRRPRRGRSPRAPPRAARAPTPAGAARRPRASRPATASDAIGSARSKPVVQTTMPASGRAGERVEVGEQVAVAALDVQVRAVRARDLAERDDVDERADDARSRRRSARARRAARSGGARPRRRSAGRGRAASAPFDLRREDLGAAEAEGHPAARAAGARAGPPRRSARARRRRRACARRPRAGRASRRRSRAPPRRP